MAIYYVDSTKTGGTNAGTSWENAYLTFEQGRAAATQDGDFIYVGHAHSESLSADATYTFQNNVRVLCVNNTGNVTGDLATTGVIGNQASAFSITLGGAYKIFIYGLSFKLSTGGGSQKTLTLNATDGGHMELEQCSFYITGASTSYLKVSGTSSNQNSHTRIKSCTINFSASGQYILISSSRQFFDAVNISGTGPSILFKGGSVTGLYCSVFDSDLSLVTGTLVGDLAGAGAAQFDFSNCRLGTNSILATATSVLNKGQTTVNLYNCASDATHYAFGHYDAFGKTEATTIIYANSGAKYDGTNGVSWKITTTGNCSYWTPYVSPWVQKAHSGTSAITPRLEILRDGSSTAYYDDEVWAEFSYQGTSGYPLGVLVNDRMTPLGTRAAQGSSSLGASDWSGENATAWFGKLEPTASVTPAEIGHLMARVCVGATNATVYVDPTIRTS